VEEPVGGFFGELADLLGAEVVDEEERHGGESLQFGFGSAFAAPGAEQGVQVGGGGGDDLEAVGAGFGDAAERAVGLVRFAGAEGAGEEEDSGGAGVGDDAVGPGGGFGVGGGGLLVAVGGGGGPALEGDVGALAAVVFGVAGFVGGGGVVRSEERTYELQSRGNLVCRHLLEK